MKASRIGYACICVLPIIVASGCATDEPDIPRAELRKLLADEYGYERLDIRRKGLQTI